MRNHTDCGQDQPGLQALDSVQPVVLLCDLETSLAQRVFPKPAKDDDWRLSYSNRPLRTWRLSK